MDHACEVEIFQSFAVYVVLRCERSIHLHLSTFSGNCHVIDHCNNLSMSFWMDDSS